MLSCLLSIIIIRAVIPFTGLLYSRWKWNSQLWGAQGFFFRSPDMSFDSASFRKVFWKYWLFFLPDPKQPKMTAWSVCNNAEHEGTFERIGHQWGLHGQDSKIGTKRPEWPIMWKMIDNLSKWTKIDRNGPKLLAIEPKRIHSFYQCQMKSLTLRNLHLIQKITFCQKCAKFFNFSQILQNSAKYRRII